jgi:hypothetical protein
MLSASRTLRGTSASYQQNTRGLPKACPQETGPRRVDARLAKSAVALYALPTVLDTHALSSPTRAAAHACSGGPHRTADWGITGSPSAARASSVPSDLPLEWRLAGP